MIQNIGIIGAGQMGAGIAHVTALSGRKVVLLDVDENVLNKAIGGIDRNLKRQVTRGKITEGSAERALSSIVVTTNYND